MEWQVTGRTPEVGPSVRGCHVSSYPRLGLEMDDVGDQQGGWLRTERTPGTELSGEDPAEVHSEAGWRSPF